MKLKNRVSGLVFLSLFAAYSLIAPPALALTKYDTREPMTCSPISFDNVKVLSLENVEQLVTCSREHEYSRAMFLIRDLKVQIGSGRRFNPATDLMNDVKEKTLIYPIRGSWTQSQCRVSFPINNDKGKNCTETDVTGAVGLCYVSTFGDWSCDMSGQFGSGRPDSPAPVD